MSPTLPTETNVPSETNRLEKTLQRFWEKVHTKYVAETDTYEVQLDGKTLKTPLGYNLALPGSRKQLAHLIAHEWANIPELKVKPGSLPLTSLASRTIDLDNTGGEGGEAVDKVGRREDICVNLLRYLDTDTCLIFATKEEYEGKLRARQDELYLPLIEEYNEYFTKYAHQHKLLPEEKLVELTYLDCETDGLLGNEQSLSTQSVVLEWLELLSTYDLVALEKAVLTSKSFLCGATLLRSSCTNLSVLEEFYQSNKTSPENYYIKSIGEIVEMGNLETIFQTEQWGEVEDTHDVDKVDWLRSLTSAALLVHEG